MPPSSPYRVFFYAGDELGLKTRVQTGRAYLDESTLHVQGQSSIDVPFDDLQGVTLFRLHGLGRVIKIDHKSGRLFIAVVRFMIGQFAFINFFKTGELHEKLRVAGPN